MNTAQRMYETRKTWNVPSMRQTIKCATAYACTTVGAHIEIYGCVLLLARRVVDIGYCYYNFIPKLLFAQRPRCRRECCS